MGFKAGRPAGFSVLRCRASSARPPARLELPLPDSQVARDLEIVSDLSAQASPESLSSRRSAEDADSPQRDTARATAAFSYFGDPRSA
jgi:hypothetical protein